MRSHVCMSTHVPKLSTCTFFCKKSIGKRGSNGQSLTKILRKSQVSMSKINKDWVTHFSQSIALKLKKVLRKSQAQLREKVKKSEAQAKERLLCDQSPSNSGGPL